MFVFKDNYIIIIITHTELREMFANAVDVFANLCMVLADYCRDIERPRIVSRLLPQRVEGLPPRGGPLGGNPNLFHEFRVLIVEKATPRCRLYIHLP